jgi:dTDP-4-dehydrorhamnose reductase
MSTGCIWITGAGGLIGGCLLKAGPAFFPSNPVVGLTRPDLDLTNYNLLRRQFQRQRPRIVVHCAALSRSPACQADPALARKLNVEVTKVLADLAADIPFLFFSTDLVFDGMAGNYDESAAVNPLSVYAETKVLAERIVLANPGHTVIRTSLNGGCSPAGDRGFNEEMRNAWRAGKTLRLFTDEFRSPVPAVVTARATWELALSARPGLYHVAGSERLSRWQIGQLVSARCPDLKPRLEPASLAEYAGAPRPPDTSLNCAKAQKLLSFGLPGLGAWLEANPQAPF